MDFADKLKRFAANEGYYCAYGHWHSNTPNEDTIAALEETEVLPCPNH